tara:strand:+ start:1946 stop:2134 length:189 start_codon:yes stop_codon:yes gene_type:complete
MKHHVSKRILGFASYLIGLAMSICAGFEFYNIEPMLILAILANGTALLGIDAYKRFEDGKVN